MSTVEGHGAACCWRPVREGRDRCLWHANEAEKPRAALEAHRPQPGERLDGAVLRGVSLPNVTWLRDTVLIGADFTDASLPAALVRRLPTSPVWGLSGDTLSLNGRNIGLLPPQRRPWSRLGCLGKCVASGNYSTQRTE